MRLALSVLGRELVAFDIANDDEGQGYLDLSSAYVPEYEYEADDEEPTEQHTRQRIGF